MDELISGSALIGYSSQYNWPNLKPPSEGLPHYPPISDDVNQNYSLTYGSTNVLVFQRNIQHGNTPGNKGEYCFGTVSTNAGLTGCLYYCFDDNKWSRILMDPNF